MTIDSDINGRCRKVFKLAMEEKVEINESMIIVSMLIVTTPFSLSSVLESPEAPSYTYKRDWCTQNWPFMCFPQLMSEPDVCGRVTPVRVICLFESLDSASSTS